jgi:osmotically-inducible protein OsmY
LRSPHGATGPPGVKAVANEQQVRVVRTRGTHDADIAETAGQLLGAAIDVPSETVKADVHDRVITLSGQVTWDYQRDAAVRAVMYIRGVIAVANTITLRRGEAVQPNAPHATH